MKTIVVQAIAISLLLWVIFLSFAFAIDAPKIDTKVFVEKDADIVRIKIESWSKVGYKVQSISCQSIATGSSFAHKGDIILVMVK